MRVKEEYLMAYPFPRWLEKELNQARSLLPDPIKMEPRLRRMIPNSLNKEKSRA